MKYKTGPEDSDIEEIGADMGQVLIDLLNEEEDGLGDRVSP